MSKKTEQHDLVASPEESTFPLVAAGDPEMFLADLKEEMGGQQFFSTDLERIIISGVGAKHWKLKETGDIIDKLTGVILEHHTERAKYAGPYDETEEGQPPECSSRDGLTGTPSEGSDLPGGECETCPYNQWGDEGKECSEWREVLVLREGNMLPSRLKIPTTSLPSFRKETLRLISQGDLPRKTLLEIALEPRKTRAGRPASSVVLKKVRALSAEEAQAIRAFSAILTKQNAPSV